MSVSQERVVSTLQGPILNRRTAAFGAVLLLSSSVGGAALPQHAPYPVFLTSAVIVGLLVGFVGLAIFLRNRVGSMEFDPEAKLLTLRTARADRRLVLENDIEFAEYRVPAATPYLTGCQLLFLRQGDASASLWYMNAGPEDVARWGTLPPAYAGRSSLRISPEAGRVLHLFLRRARADR